MRPVIFIWGESTDYVRYQTAICAVGGDCLVTRDLSASVGCQGLLLPGGGDPDPALYGESLAGSHPPDAMRDGVELALIRQFTEAGMPILGICRGLQILNVFFGGTLVQDLPGHSQIDGVDCLHTVCAAPDSRLYHLYGSEFSVNSAHHQAVRCPGSELLVTATAADGVIEALCHRTLPIAGVQWHPERLTGALAIEGIPDGEPIFSEFVSACRCRH